MWAIIVLKEGGSLDVGGRLWESGKPLRTKKQSLINWAKSNGRFRVIEESEPEKVPKKPEPKKRGPKPKVAAVSEVSKVESKAKPKAVGRPKAKPKAKARSAKSVAKRNENKFASKGPG